MQGLAKQSNKYMELPSTFQIGCEVCVQFGDSNPILRNCHVTKVLFARDKVFYDLQVAVYEPGETPDGYLPKCIGHTRIHSVDSSFVKPFDYGRTVITKWNPRTEYPDSDRLVNCRISYKENTPCFYARVRWQGGGLEWFNDNDVPIKDSVQFEWTEIKQEEESGKGKTVITKWYHRSDHPDTESLVECRYIGSSVSDSVGPNFFARFKFDGNGFEWFDEQGTPIRDAVQFEWTEVKRND